MSVKKRIFLLNISMVLAAMIIMLGVITGFIRILTNSETDGRSWITNIDDNVVIINQILEDAGTEKPTWEELSAAVKQYEYELVVVKQGEVVFQSLEDDVSTYLDAFLKSNIQGIHSIAGYSFVDKWVTYEMEYYYVIAVQEIDLSQIESDIHAIFAKFQQKVAGISVLTIIILVLMGWFFSRRLIGNIMKPLELLTDGAKRVADGDMEHPIQYKGDVEFEGVCCAFNTMQENVRQNEEARKLYEQARTDMVTSISHDLRTPLTSIKGYIKGILDGVANTEEKQRQYLKIAYDTTGDMDILLQKLFVFSKIETGSMPFDFISVNLSEYMNQYVASRERQYMEKCLELRLQASLSSYEGKYDIAQMQRVFDNLIENSLHYANRQQVLVTIKYVETDEEEILIFKDNGNGIPYDKLPFIFERFYRCDESRGTEGNGVGLYIVKYIVEAHGGYVMAENRSGLMITMHFKKGDESNEQNPDC